MRLQIGTNSAAQKEVGVVIDVRKRRESDVETPKQDKHRGRSTTFWVLAIVITVLIGIGIGWLVFRDSGDETPIEDSAVSATIDSEAAELIEETDTLPSQILAGSEGPIEWRWWDPLSDGTSQATGARDLVTGNNCYGSGSYQRRSAVVEFKGGTIDFSLGLRSTPDVVVTDGVGIVTNVGNPFGELAWLCSAATSDTHILAVGSGVSWSEDAVTWHGVGAFEEESHLRWAAAGPGGYMVLGGEGAVWYSEDLQSWYETTLNEGYGTSIWGVAGPTGVSVGEEIVISMFDDGWVGTHREG